MDGSSEDLNQEIYDSAVVARYRRSTSRIKYFTVNASFDQFVFNAVLIIADIIPTKANMYSQLMISPKYCPTSRKPAILFSC